MAWKSYEELAWTDQYLAGPEEYREEAHGFVEAIRQAHRGDPRTLLHLGSGAGNHDLHFKEHFQVTGVDISGGMLQQARALNPDVEYLLADMRVLDLNRRFDVVVIPESVMYMTTIDDVRRVIRQAASHLNPGGVLLIVTHTREEFRENNFAYTGEGPDVHITLLENNYRVSEETYEAVLVYLIRRNGQLTVETDVHICGLFAHQQWLDLFAETGLSTPTEKRHDRAYDRFVLNDGTYPLTVFLCRNTGGPEVIR